MSSTHDRPPVIADVARLAGVSVPTVSRVLNGSSPVSEEKRTRVLSAIAKLGYRPNAAARALGSGQRSLIVVFAGNTTRYGYAMTIQGIEEAARQGGYAVLISVVESDDPAVVRAALDLVLMQPVAGAIVLEFDPQGLATLQALPRSIPVVSAAAATAGVGVPCARLDDREAAVRATEYLLGLGHRTVHHVAIPPSGWPSGRATGWRQALERAGVPVPEMVVSDWDPESGYRCGLQMARRDDVSAVLCGNDEIAIGLMRGLQEGGRRIPEDVSVIGFDGQRLTEFVMPSLTTVEQDFADLGRRTFAMLQVVIRGDARLEDSTVVPRLVIRESTGPAPRR